MGKLKIRSLDQRLHDIIFTLLIILLSTGIAFVLFHLTVSSSANIASMFILALILVTSYTDGYIYGIIYSLLSVVCVNFFFTYPFFDLNFTLTGYPITFLLMAAIALTTSAASSHLKIQSKQLEKQKKILNKAEKEKMRANLLRAISHDLRTPLTCIIGEADTYFETKDSNEKDSYVHKINDDAHWLLNMVENLLSVTRIQGDNTVKVHKSSELIEEIISESLSRFRKRQPDAVVEVTIPDDYILIPMDPLLIEQVIVNLLDNAYVHSKSNREIQLTVTDETDCIFCHVRDYGVGIDPGMIDTIFDGSGTSDSKVSDAHRGIGIGLSICKTIIEAHDGNITAVNHTNGVEFVFTLPKEADFTD